MQIYKFYIGIVIPSPAESGTKNLEILHFVQDDIVNF